ncbi:MAG: 16S rRNA (cytidine(1402)-2'-O)-methyltransferase [Betaproteobacteria bacterium]|jgi:16S rRNA (cytidine1402-2'-O)-methyltransferase|nr:16S rRNA (cytidine(1402)-2'-O)-methyltransferase [Rhodocyclaceae bacterium]MCA3133835.1 16S rRNA (cytidine(1402)-2'-O)-methyltransferase [Rhodocyclaceae bacterium]MCA3142841.1 16S rRNA (cytidine(1402)-2'-O)-methyltransferase [Rhodocyclaceae bacterium]MCA3145541.1 16S rRNA (cytidine(1402)-2'-O)-methyltransferase [Rhodocyclaceae bacterium]MCE2897776.1 16S rRNA (cytidine(1402)-2'-O)-methyltransferase [Betaproteobacteria bacterium]
MNGDQGADGRGLGLHGEASSAEASTLYVVATPIGNLRDLTLRALDLLRTVDVMAAEDTRHSRVLLDAFGIATRMIPVHQHNQRAAAGRVVELLRQGRSVALVTDAGTPGISDPGAAVVREARAAGLRVVPVPGASAVTCALSVAGIEETGFCFAGFLPPKGQARRQSLRVLADSAVPVVLFEAPHRIRDTLAAMALELGGARRVLLLRELTKRFEEIHECTLGEAPAWLDADAHRERGEFVVVLHAAPPAEEAAIAGAHTAQLLALLLEELPAARAARLAARISGAPREVLYRQALELSERT